MHEFGVLSSLRFALYLFAGQSKADHYRFGAHFRRCLIFALLCVGRPITFVPPPPPLEPLPERIRGRISIATRTRHSIKAILTINSSRSVVTLTSFRRLPCRPISSIKSLESLHDLRSQSLFVARITIDFVPFRTIDHQTIMKLLHLYFHLNTIIFLLWPPFFSSLSFVTFRSHFHALIDFRSLFSVVKN
jgi:hypothetical protein